MHENPLEQIIFFNLSIGGSKIGLNFWPDFRKWEKFTFISNDTVGYVNGYYANDDDDIDKYVGKNSNGFANEFL